MERFNGYVADSPVESESEHSSQATTLRYVASPDGDGDAEGPNQFVCVGPDVDPQPGVGPVTRRVRTSSSA